jgi:hypothetical protein
MSASSALQVWGLRVDGPLGLDSRVVVLVRCSGRTVDRTAAGLVGTLVARPFRTTLLLRLLGQLFAWCLAHLVLLVELGGAELRSGASSSSD